MQFSTDGKGQPYVEWDIGAGILKRAWIQHRKGTKDWAGTGRYLNVVRVEVPHAGPRGRAADFPIFDADATANQILTDFVHAVCQAVRRPPPY